MKRPILVVRNVLLSAQDELLMGQRLDTRLWELPGGKVDDEPVENAARREMMEETGITLLGTPKLLGYYDGTSIFNPATRYVDFFLLWDKWEGFARTAEPDKTLWWKWFKIADFPLVEDLMPSTADFLLNILPNFVQSPPEDVGYAFPLLHEEGA